MRVRSPMRKYPDFQKADLLNNYVTPVLNFIRLFRTVRRFIRSYLASCVNAECTDNFHEEFSPGGQFRIESSRIETSAVFISANSFVL